MRRRIPGEELPSLWADIERLKALAYPGDTSPMGQMMSRDHFLSALDDDELEMKIRETEPRDLGEA